MVRLLHQLEVSLSEPGTALEEVVDRVVVPLQFASSGRGCEAIAESNPS
jgi:hypothetical protein